MTNVRKEKIANKIEALLAKTVENGATEQEAILAMKKAQQLMKEYYLSVEDIEAYKNENNLVLETLNDKYKGCNVSQFYYYLGRLFDVKIIKTNRFGGNYMVYGFEQDVKLVMWFHDFIIESMVAELEKFYKTDDCKILVNKGLNKRTINNSFIKGYTFGVSDKIEQIYNDRLAEMRTDKQNGVTSTEIIMVDKSKTIIDSLYDVHKIRIQNNVTKINVGVKSTYNAGHEKGSQIELNRPINGTTPNPTQKQLA